MPPDAKADAGPLTASRVNVDLVLGNVALLVSESARGMVLGSLYSFVNTVNGSKSTQMLALAVSIFSAGRLLSSFVLGYASDRFTIRTVLVGALVVHAAGQLLYGFSESLGIGALVLSRLVIGFGSGVLGVSRALVCAHLPKAQRTRHFSLLGGSKFVGYALTPIVSASLASNVTGFIMSAACLVTGCAIHAWMTPVMAVRKATPQEALPLAAGISSTGASAPTSADLLAALEPAEAALAAGDPAATASSPGASTAAPPPTARRRAAAPLCSCRGLADRLALAVAGTPDAGLPFVLGTLLFVALNLVSKGVLTLMEALLAPEFVAVFTPLDADNDIVSDTNDYIVWLGVGGLLAYALMVWKPTGEGGAASGGGVEDENAGGGDVHAQGSHRGYSAPATASPLSDTSDRTPISPARGSSRGSSTAGDSASPAAAGAGVRRAPPRRVGSRGDILGASSSGGGDGGIEMELSTFSPGGGGSRRTSLSPSPSPAAASYGTVATANGVPPSGDSFASLASPPAARPKPSSAGAAGREIKQSLLLAATDDAAAASAAGFAAPPVASSPPRACTAAALSALAAMGVWLGVRLWPAWACIAGAYRAASARVSASQVGGAYRRVARFVDPALLVASLLVTAAGAAIAAPNPRDVSFEQMTTGFVLIWSVGSPVADVLTASMFSVMVSDAGGLQGRAMGWITAAGSLGRIAFPALLGFMPHTAVMATAAVACAVCGICAALYLRAYPAASPAAAAAAASYSRAQQRQERHQQGPTTALFGGAAGAASPARIIVGASTVHAASSAAGFQAEQT